MRALARNFKQQTLMRWNGVYKFQQKINVSINSGNYILKTAETYEELIESLKLRHDVFYKEFQGKDYDGVDLDKFDSHFDHLIIVHKETQKVIGTYRLNSSSFSSLSYTQLEFNLAEIFKLQGPHLELGRACIHKDHRRGTVLSLLWRGITEYMNLSGANVLFGCSSVKVNSSAQAALIYQYLCEQNSISESIFSSPTKAFQMNDFDIWQAYFKKGLSIEQKSEAEALIPPLLKSYLKFGAKIASEPAFDRDFDCIDLLTVMKKEDMTNLLARRFQVIQ
jgi:putative hemolysin